MFLPIAFCKPEIRGELAAVLRQSNQIDAGNFALFRVPGELHSGAK
jgi:hypothetical protein